MNLYFKVTISLLKSWSIERQGKDLIGPFTLDCFLFINLMYLLEVVCNLDLIALLPRHKVVSNIVSSLNHSVVQ